MIGETDQIIVALPLDIIRWIDGQAALRLTSDEARVIIAASPRFQEANGLLARAVKRSTPIRRVVEIDQGEEILIRERR
jgi:hypothetical protein